MLSKNQQKFISSLALKKVRVAEQLFVVEGVKLTDELLAGDLEVRQLFYTPGWMDRQREGLLRGRNCEVTEVSADELKKISQLTTPNQVLAVAAIPAIPKNAVRPGYSLALDRINDPGNLGTIIRIADWFNISSIYCSPDTTDCYNSKCVQASMGSLFRIQPVYRDLEQVIAEFRNLRFPVYAAVLGGRPLSAVAFSQNALVLMGSESHGLAGNLEKLSDEQITIEKSGRAESLNVAVAAGIICSRLPQ